MGRIQGAKHRMCRRTGVRLCTSDKCPTTRRNYPPGVHGIKGRGKLTSFGKQLQEKQKARFSYCIMEQQLRRYYESAINRTGATDLILLQLLESRLDNVVYRLGMSKTRSGARQLVGHGHVMVNGKKVDIPSYAVKPGQAISVDTISAGNKYFAGLTKNWGKQAMVPDWVALDPKELKGQLLALPTLEQVKPPFDLKLVAEFYSR